MAVPNTNFNQLTALVNDYFMKDLRQVVFNQHPILQKMHAAGTKPRGGANIRQDLLYQFTKDGAYKDYATLPTSAEDQFTASVYEWKNYSQHFTISVPEIRKSSGPESIFNMLKRKTQAAGEAIRDSIATDMLFYDSTASPVSYGDNDAEVHSIPRLLGDNTFPVSSDTVGQIPKSNTFWQGKIVDAGGGFAAAVMTNMNKLWYKCVDGSKHPDAVLMHNNNAETYDNAADLKERFTNSRINDAGFTTAFFRGIEVFVDLHVNTDHVIMLTTNDLELVSHRDENFRFDGFEKPTDKNVRVGQIYWMGDMTLLDARHSGLIKNL